MDSLGNKLAAARREADNVDERITIGDWTYDEGISRWCLPFVVSLEEPREMPKGSSWILTVEDCYPAGEVRVWPAREGGITDTYPHQLNNGLEPHGLLCRSGRLCLFGESAEAGIPDDSDFKVACFIEKTLEWIDCANEGALMAEGEHLELPAFNYGSGPAIMYLEDDITKMMWDAIGDITAGLARIRVIGDRLLALYGFSLGKDRHEIEPPWGEAVTSAKAECEAVWVLAGEAPSVKRWQAPNNFAELREYLDRCGVDFDEVVSRYGASLRDGKQHYFLIGVPVPENVKGQADHLSWFAFLMPALTTKSNLGKNAVGKASTLKTVDKVKLFAGNGKVNWVQTHNVAKPQLHSRGSLCDSLAESNVLVVGAGSLGSLVSEALVRGGVSNIAISDSDSFNLGNITRHVLGFSAVGRLKAHELCERLKSISPNVESVQLAAIGFDGGPRADDFDLIVDCTGSARVLDWIEAAKPKRSVQLAVFSFGIGAKSVYIWMGLASDFTHEAYNAKFADRIGSDMRNAGALPWEGTGCWSPVFPAQHSDVAMAAAMCMKALDAFVGSGDGRNVAQVLEFQYNAEGLPLSMRSVEL